jgi:hypothetical protein
MTDKPTIDLRCGNCLEVMKSMPDKSVDLGDRIRELLNSLGYDEIYDG